MLVFECFRICVIQYATIPVILLSRELDEPFPTPQREQFLRAHSNGQGHPTLVPFQTWGTGLDLQLYHNLEDPAQVQSPTPIPRGGTSTSSCRPRLDRTIAYHDVVDFFYLERFMGLVAIMRPGSLLCLQPLATFLKQAGRLHCSGKPNSAWKSSTMGP